MLARLGYVFEFCGAATALIILLFIMIAIYNTPREALPGEMASFVLAFLAAGLAGLIGWTLRYILAGPTPKKAKGK